MVKSKDSSIVQEPHRFAVRCLFIGFFLSTFVLILVRECFGEPYPGPFMPAFKGTAIRIDTPAQASIVLPTMIVTFSDQTTTEISQPSLFGYASNSIHRNILFMIVPDPSAEEEEGLKKKFRLWLSRVFPRYHIQKVTAPAVVQDDVRQYLYDRLKKIYPSKTPVSLTISLFRDTFPLADFHKITSQPISQSTISFHEGA